MDVAIGHMVSADLLAALKEFFPLQRPQATDNERTIWIKSGNQEVIEFLQRQFDDSINQALENSKDVSRP